MQASEAMLLSSLGKMHTAKGHRISGAIMVMSVFGLCLLWCSHYRACVFACAQAEASAEASVEDSSESVKTADLPAYINLSVPFYYQETPNYCGEASLAMVFDYYGPQISQEEIAAVAHNGIGTDPSQARRAAHFSNMSRARGDVTLKGYTNRSIGYAAFEHWWSTPSSPSVDAAEALTDLKAILALGYPLMVTTWYDENKSTTHWRVLKGYNDSSEEFILHDPAQPGWGKYHGPDIRFDYYDFINNIWNVNGNRYALFVSPWEIEIWLEGEAITGVSTMVYARITYPCPAPYTGSDYVAAACEARLEGENFKIIGDCSVPLDIAEGGDYAIVSWEIVPTAPAINISVTATGVITGYTTSPKGDNYVYRDVIGSVSSVMLNARANSPPRVEVMSPQEGDIYDNYVLVCWKASDRDGDNITIVLEVINATRGESVYCEEHNNSGVAYISASSLSNGAYQVIVRARSLGYEVTARSGIFYINHMGVVGKARSAPINSSIGLFIFILLLTSIVLYVLVKILRRNIAKDYGDEK